MWKWAGWAERPAKAFINIDGQLCNLVPALILPGKGVMGIENTWVVTETGLERLTRFPDEVCVR